MPVTSAGESYRATAEAAWLWAMRQVRWADDGPWFPESLVADVEADVPDDRDSMHSGIGGLAHTLAEIRLARPWTALENDLADAAAERLIREIPQLSDVSFFDGLVSTIGALVALGRLDGVRAAVERLQELATDDGWPQTFAMPPRYLTDARLNDLTLGTAGVLLGGVWAARHGVDGGLDLAEQAAKVLLAEAEPTEVGVTWPFVPERFRTQPGTEMPNLSHGVAGIVATLAAAGVALDRPEWVALGVRGAEHLVSIGVTDGRGFVVPRYIPSGINDEDDFTYTWCHGAAGTSLAFAALDAAGAPPIAGVAASDWRRRCLHSVRTSGLPARLRPGFWDNDGRCCGTAGVGDIFLDSWHRTGDEDDLEFARVLADTLVERAIEDESGTYWRFLEHRNEEPLLPPRVGWMQGAAGIAAFLFHAARVVEQGRAAEPQSRMDTWWASA